MGYLQRLSELRFALLLVLLLSFQDFASAQKREFKGRLLDSMTEEPIPFAHFNLLSSPGAGFISDRQGTFRFTTVPDSANRLRVKVTSIGYESKAFALEPDTDQTIYLKASAQELQAVTISQYSLEEELLRKVIEAIPENYSLQHERLIGRTIEEAFQDSAYQIPYYKSEATVEADKLSYDKKRTLGNVAVGEGNTVKYPALEETDIEIIAGTHNIHRFDFVMMRLGPLTTNRIKKYYLNITDTINSGNESLIRLFFKGKDYKGRLFINATNYAVQRGEFEYTEEELKRKNTIKDTERHALKFVTEYSATDKVYRLRLINYTTAFSESKTADTPNFYLNNTFSIENYQNASEQIGFTDRVNFREKFSAKLPVFEVPSPDALPTAPEDQKKGNPADFFTRISYASSLSFNQMNRNLYTATFLTSAIDGGFTSTVRDRYVLSNLFQMAYRLKKGQELFLSVNTARNRYSTFGLGMQWRRPLFGSLRFQGVAGLQVGYRQMQHRFISESFEGEFELNDKKFDSGKVNIYATQREFFVAPNVGVEYKITPIFGLRVQVTYYETFSDQRGLLFVEEDETWGWNRSRTFVNDQQNAVNTTNALFDGNLSFAIGLFLIN